MLVSLQYYQTEGDFSNTCFFLVKGGWLNETDLFAVSLAYPELQDMIESVPGLLQLDFSSLRDPVLDYATQTLIEPSRVQLMTACAVHYNLNIGLVVRYLGGEYTASWRSVTDILNAAAPYVTEEVFSHLQRVLTLGCPAEFDWHEPVENKNRFIVRENLPNVNQYAEVAQKTVTKEVRNSHLIPFASWVCVASAHARHTPQNVLIKPNKKPRLIWDGSSREFWYETTMNMMTPTLRPIAVAIDKLMELLVAYKQILLGLEVDTRAMTVSITTNYRDEVLSILRSTWHVHRQTFTVKEMELLVGKLGRIAQAFRPLFFLMSHLYSSLAYALRENNSHLVNTSRRYRAMLQTSKQPILNNGETDRREVNFAASKVAKAMHGCRQKYRIPASLAAELAFLTELIADSTIPLSTPIGHLVPRDDLLSMWADSCKTSGGGWSTGVGGT